MAKPSLINRFFNIFRSEAHSLLDSIEDPKKALEQQVTDFGSKVNKTEAAIAQAIGNVRMMEADRLKDVKRYTELSEKAQRAMGHAKAAKERGDDAEAARITELARKLVEEQMRLEAEINANTESINAQNTSIETMKNSLSEMRQKLRDAVRMKDTLIARAVSADAQNNVNKAMRELSGIDTTSGFGRLEAKIKKEEAKVIGYNELGSATAETQLASLDALDADSEVERRLAELSSPAAPQFRLTALKGEVA